MSLLLPTKGSGGRPARDPDYYLDRIRRWASLYGEPPRASDLNPSAARWARQEWRIARYEKGDPETGEPWPSLNAIKRAFGGSLTAAIVAAGFEPPKPGPHRRLDVPRERGVAEMGPDARVVLEAAEARVRGLERKLEVRERELARARASRVPVAPRPVVRRVEGKAGLAAAEKRARLAEANLAAAVAALREAQGELRLVRSAFKRKEAAHLLARERVTELKADLRREARRADAAERAPEVVREVIVEKRVIVEGEARIVREASPTADALRDAQAEAREANRRAGEAEKAAERAVAGYLELSAAVSGVPRRLSPEEVRGLRKEGPAGPVLVADAFRAVALARKAGGSGLPDALLGLAAAAVSWRERL